MQTALFRNAAKKFVKGSKSGYVDIKSPVRPNQQVLCECITVVPEIFKYINVDLSASDMFH